MFAKENHFSKQVIQARQIFFGIPQVDSSDEFRLISVGCERCLPEYVVERDSFPQYAKEADGWAFTTFDLVVEGTGTLLLNQNHYNLRAGSLYFYSKKVPHRIETNQSSPMLKYFLVCAHRPTVPPFEDISIIQSGLIKIQSMEEIIDLFELILSNANIDSHLGNPICDSLTKCLILKILEKAKEDSHAESRAWTTYKRILQHIRKNYYQIKTIEQLAKEVHVDAAYLSRIFKRFHHDTPYKFLTRLRMSHAASLLLNSGDLVKNVAYELGYENPFHFSRAFKSVYGNSPENFVREREGT
tara:strand:+ start:528 stop:1427 length:900 start_codon:yes stop_codon:yes gene_type:complete